LLVTELPLLYFPPPPSHSDAQANQPSYRITPSIDLSFGLPQLLSPAVKIPTPAERPPPSAEKRTSSNPSSPDQDSTKRESQNAAAVRDDNDRRVIQHDSLVQNDVAKLKVKWQEADDNA
jgi:hypothetical protein